MLFIAILGVSANVSAETFLSTPSEVGVSDIAAITVEETEFSSFEAEITIFNDSSQQYTNKTLAEDNVASTTVKFSDIGLSEGDYSVNVQVTNQSEGLKDQDSTEISVTSETSNADMLALTSKDLTGSCPLNSSAEFVVNTGDSATITVNGNEHEFETNYVAGGGSSATIKVDRETESVEEGDTVRVSDQDVRVSDIISFGGGKGTVEFSLRSPGCKLIQVNVTEDNDSNLTQVSKSGKPLTASLVGGNKYIALVDTERAGEYDSVFWDDDDIFNEENETGRPEKRFLEPGDSLTKFEVGGQQANLRFLISGDNLVLAVPPTSEEVPLRDGENLDYAFIVHSEYDSGLGLNLNVEPIQGRNIEAKSTNLRTDNEKDLTPSDSTTNEYGLTGIGTIQSAGIGRHKVNIGNMSSQYYEVRNFDINYDVMDASTGNSKRTFQPGDKVRIKAIAAEDGNQIDFNTINIRVIDPSGDTYNEELTSSTSTEFELPEDIAGGKSTVTIEVKDTNGNVQKASTSFDVKKFRTHTITLRNEEGRPVTSETLAPNSTGYLFVGAVKIGTFGEVKDILGAEFYDIDNPNTSTDECKSNVGDIRGTIDGQDAVEVVNKTNINNSQLFANAVIDLPKKMDNQCILKYNISSEVSGFFSGSVTAERVGTNETQKGRVTFGVSEYKMEGEPRSANSNERKSEFGKNERIGMRPEIREIGTNDQFPNSNITDASITGLEGRETNPVSNVAFNKSGNNLVSFESPNASGTYEAKILVEINTSEGDKKAVTGHGFFKVNLFGIETKLSSSGKRWEVTPNQNLKIDTDVKKPTGGDKQGVELNVTELRNFQKGTSYLQDINFDPNTTNENGSAQLTIQSPSEGWNEGNYKIGIKGIDPEGDKDTGDLYFSVDKYDARATKILDGEKCRYYCKPTLGDNLQFDVNVSNTSSGAPLSSSISLDGSSIKFYGNRRTYSSENIDLEKHAQLDNGKLNLSTSGLDPGSYGVNIRVELDNSDDYVNADSRIKLKAFDSNFSRKEVESKFSRRKYHPGTNVTYQFNASQEANYTIKIDSLRGYNRETGQNIEMKPNVEESFEDTDGEINLTIPSNAQEGRYSGHAEISSGGKTQYENLRIRVSTLGVSIPQRKGLRYQSKLRTESDSIFDTDKNSTCSDLLDDSNLTFESSSPNNPCRVAEQVEVDTDQPYNVLWLKRGSGWENASVYITQNSIFNQTDDIASNLSKHEKTSEFDSGLRMNISWTNKYKLVITPTNGFNSFEGPVVVQDPGDSRYQVSMKENNYDLEKDLNGDGDMQDILNTLLVKNSGNFELRLSLGNNLTASNNSTHVLDEKEKTSLGGKKFYSGIIRNGSYSDYKSNLIFTRPAEYSNLGATVAEGQNYTFPTIITYPNGTAADGKQVNVSRIIRRSDSKVFESSATAQTDDSGIAFTETSLPSLQKRGTVNFRVVPSTKVDGKEKELERFSSPQVTVSKFNKEEENFVKLDMGTLTSYSNDTKSETVTNIEDSEGIEIKDSEYKSREYRYGKGTEDRKSGCYGLDRGWNDCEDSVSLLMYGEDDGDEEMNVSNLVIGDETFDDIDEYEFGDRNVEANLSVADFQAPYIRFGGIPSKFATFNESKNRLSVYGNRNDHPEDKNVVIALRFTETFDRTSALNGDLIVNSITYNGETYDAQTEFNKTLDKNGLAVFKISRSDFKGNTSSWETGSTIRINGEVDGTSYQSNIEIQESGGN
ncbi:MAG: hypothetical protein BRC29_04555 [Nanohaloarchaea archaeon SW_7_43_1]|nr:MAG: hypothetical protein BRC29_04555 [Nanohaloarchaea archaeon SW_7_43_1]